MTEKQEPAVLPEGWLEIESLDIEAQGVARRPDGKVVFVEGALPGEQVTVKVHRKKNNWEQASLVELHRESAQRVRPRCPHFGLHEGACGGCKMQHLHVGAQVAIKQRVLEDNLWHLAKVKADTMCARRKPCWSVSTSARAATWPTSANATWCRRTSAICCCRCGR
jgi:23S rRNA (uracil1939-C5)-methyltransferase